MQWPPTSPGLNGIKFHFVSAAANTSLVSIFILSKIIDSSFTYAIFKSLCVFSIALAASATFIEGATYVPAVIIFLYKLFIIFVTSLLDPDTTLTIFFIVYFLSPGFILSGE